MAPVIKHPKSEEGASAQMRQLKQCLAEDRARAIATLNDAVANLETLSALCDAPQLRTLAVEYSVFLSALKNMDAASLDDWLPDQLQLIKRRLLFGMHVLETLQATSAAATPHAHPGGTSHGP